MNQNYYSWTRDHFEYNLMIPLDYNYLYNVLLKNSDNSLSSITIQKHLLLIKDLYPYEIKMLYDKILNIFVSGNSYTVDNKNNITHLSYCFLKYGVDAICPQFKKTCHLCKKEYIFDSYKNRFVSEINYNNNHVYESDDSNNNSETSSIIPIEDIKKEDVCVNVSDKHNFTNIHMGVICITCGKKSVGGLISDTSRSLGNCLVMYDKHKWFYSRILICPYELNVDF